LLIILSSVQNWLKKKKGKSEKGKKRKSEKKKKNFSWPSI